MRVLVTGASGFVGASLCRQLSELGVDVLATVRGECKAEWHSCVTGDMTQFQGWRRVLAGVNVVVSRRGIRAQCRAGSGARFARRV